MNIKQNNFRMEVLQLCNSGKLNCNSWAYRKKSECISHHIKNYDCVQNRGTTYRKVIFTEDYSGNNKYVEKMTRYLMAELYDDLFGAYVHGSIGTYEEILFSDFDALVIIKNDVIFSPKRLAHVLKKLHKALLIMYEFDPLQHHGWFVLIEADFKYYPEDYFPHVLFKYAKSILPGKGNELVVDIPEEVELNRPINNIANGIYIKLNKRNYPRNMYELKSFLSQFMLLPALYVQARDKKGVYKKYSFEAAKEDFKMHLWSIMDEVSLIRKEWDYTISPLQQYIMTQPNFLAKKLSKQIAPRIPIHIKRFLSQDFYSRILKLTDSMVTKNQKFTMSSYHVNS